MIPVDRADVLDSSLEILQQFANSINVRGRFVSLYLGLRRMRADQNAALAELGSPQVTVSNEIEQYLDRLYTKSHREQPFVVLTAPFGGSTSPEAPYSALSGTTAPGRDYPTNTWRNNFGIQKGVGCPAEPDVIEMLLDDPQHRLACPHMVLDPDERHLCSIRDTAYRGEEHAIWLRQSDGGYQVVDLDRPAAFRDYLRPSGRPLPIFPLMGMLYCMAPPGVYPGSTRIGIPEFAADFGFTHEQVQLQFDCNPESEFNTAIALTVEDGRTTVGQGYVAPPTGAQGYGVPGADEVPARPPDAALNTGGWRVFRFSWKMTVLKIRYTHEKRSCHEQTTPSSHRRAESRAVTPARSGEKASLGGMQRGRNPAEPVLHVAKGAIGWSPYGVFDPSRAEP